MKLPYTLSLALALTLVGCVVVPAGPPRVHGGYYDPGPRVVVPPPVVVSPPGYYGRRGWGHGHHHHRHW